MPSASIEVVDARSMVSSSFSFPFPFFFFLPPSFSSFLPFFFLKKKEKGKFYKSLVNGRGKGFRIGLLKGGEEDVLFCGGCCVSGLM